VVASSFMVRARSQSEDLDDTVRAERSERSERS
jgi:hypothetical protein